MAGLVYTNNNVNLNSNIDNSGRLEVALNVALGEYVLHNDLLPLYFDQEVIGTGAIAYDSDINSAEMTVAANLDAAIYSTKQWHSYFPGHAQQPEFTFINFTPETNVTKRVGYFSSNTTTPFDSNKDGFYLESSGGTVKLVISKNGTATTIEQTTWNDPLDGTGASGITTDWDNFQVFLIDFLYLGGTYVNLYYVAEGKRHLIHRYNHSNNFANTIVSTPAQPIRAEIRSTGGTGTFHFVCAQVSTQGASLDLSGTAFALDTGNATISVAASGTEYALIGMKKNIRNIEFYPDNINIATSAGANESYRWRLMLNPTLSGALTYNPVANINLDYAVGNGTIAVTTPGHIIASGTGVSRNVNALGVSRALRIGQEIAGTFDELVLAYTPLQANQDIAATLNGIYV